MEFINIDKPDVHCCRTCLTEGQADMHDIFIIIEDSQNAADVLASCTSIQVIKEDFLPKEICIACYNCLTAFYKFRKIAEKIDTQLKLNLKKKQDTFLKQEHKGHIEVPNVKFKLEVDSKLNEDINENTDNYEEINDTCIFYNENHDDFIKKEANCEKDPLECKICFQQCDNIESLQQHLQIHFISQGTDDDDEIDCDICLKSFKTLSEFKQHKQYHSVEYECKSCLKSYKTINSYAAHMRKHAKNGNVNACSICGKIFNKPSRLKRHEAIHIGKAKPYQITDENVNDRQILTCDICSSRFRSRNCLTDHMKKHTPKYHSCSQCNQVFKKLGGLRRHEKNHEKWLQVASDISQDYNINLPIKAEPDVIEEHKCDECSKTFQCLNSLSAHKRKHTKRNRVLACSICGKEFKKLSHVKRHELSHDVNKPYKCFHCRRRFITEDLLKEHTELHYNRKLKPHACPLCPKAFSYLSTLASHIKIHTRDKQYLCPTCGKKFDSSNNLKQHVRRHLGLKMFSCSLCPKKFVSKGEMKSHQVTHTGERSHTCDLCGSMFTKGSSLTKHKLRHLGVKPHLCDVCPMKFQSKDHLKRHYRIHTGEKPYKCNSCDRAFTQSGDLIKHKRSHHGDNLYKCTQCPQSFRLNTQLRQHISEHYVSAKLHDESDKGEVSVKNEHTTALLPEVSSKQAHIGTSNSLLTILASK